MFKCYCLLSLVSGSLKNKLLKQRLLLVVAVVCRLCVCVTMLIVVDDIPIGIAYREF